MIEWYDFYIFGSLAAIIATQFFPGGNPTASFLKTLATFAVGFAVRSIRCARFWTDRRSDRQEVRVPHDASDHGRIDGGDWIPARLRAHRHRRSDRARDSFACCRG